MLDTLEQKHGELPTSAGLTKNGLMLQITVNPLTGAWTMMLVRPDGQACVADHGLNWRSIKPEIIGPST